MKFSEALIRFCKNTIVGCLITYMIWLLKVTPKPQAFFFGWVIGGFIIFVINLVLGRDS